MATKLDKNVSKPSTTEPGDGPADTTDPNESAQSVTPRPDTAAQKAGTVNAVLPEPERKARTTRRSGKDRTEKYKVRKPDGSLATVTRNVETGETKLS